MKNLVVLSFLFFNINLYSQENEQSKVFSNFELGFLGGINFSTLTGGSLIVEGKSNLTSSLDIKLSIGYSSIFKDDSYNVKTNRFVSFDDYHKYATYSYNVDKIEYDIIPISLGFEYIVLHDNFSPYSIFEIGYNWYATKVHTSKHMQGLDGSYDTFDELPSEYKNDPPVIPEDESYRVALGIGTKYRLNSSINLDIRYLYQFNKSLINTNQILVGINF